MTNIQKTSAEVKRSSHQTNLEELLDRTTETIVQQFGFYHAAVYLMDQTEKYMILRAACGPAAQAMLESGTSIGSRVNIYHWLGQRQ